MNRLPLVVALMMLIGFVGNLHSAPIYAPEAEVMDRLAAVYATKDPLRISTAFRAMGEYGLPAARIVESSINAMGYDHFESGRVESAIAVFRMNTDTFPESANAWDSLAEAMLARGDRDMALRYYRRSLELDAENRNAALMIEKIAGGRQLSQVIGHKN